MLGEQPPPSLAPTPVTTQLFDSPPDGSKAQLVPLTTTTYNLREGLDGAWAHVPDLREFWKTPRAWQWRDVETFNLEKQPTSSCNGALRAVLLVRSRVVA